MQLSLFKGVCIAKIKISLSIYLTHSLFPLSISPSPSHSSPFHSSPSPSPSLTYVHISSSMNFQLLRGKKSTVMNGQTYSQPKGCVEVVLQLKKVLRSNRCSKFKKWVSMIDRLQATFPIFCFVLFFHFIFLYIHPSIPQPTYLLIIYICCIYVSNCRIKKKSPTN